MVVVQQVLRLPFPDRDASVRPVGLCAAVITPHTHTHSSLFFLQRICSSLGLPDGAVYDLYAKMRDAPLSAHKEGSDDAAVAVNGRIAGGRGEGRGDHSGGGGGVGGVANPAAYSAVSE